MWIVVWIQERLTTATAVLVAGTLILTLGLVSVCNGLVESGPYLEKNGLGADIWCTRLLVQNGELSSHRTAKSTLYLVRLTLFNMSEFYN